MFMLHQVLPHVHHEHEGFENSIGYTEHQPNDHEKDHHHDNEDEDEGFDFFGFLLGNHVHSVQADNILAVKYFAKQQVTVKDISSDATPTSLILSIEGTGQKKAISRQHPPDYFYDIHLSTSSLRGPPSLG